MKNNNINPIGNKGNAQVNRMKSLMGMSPINENTNNSVIELTKVGPDGKVYGIVRENHTYYIKTSTKKKNLVVENFDYFGGLKNKTLKSYNSYSKAVKQLNLEFISINEALNKSGNINILENDALSESFESYNEAPKPSQPDSPLGTVKDIGKNEGHDDEIIGDEGEDGNPDVDTPKVVEEGQSIELTETEKAIDNIIRELNESSSGLKITKAIMNIKKGELSSKKKV
tara:strand:+ start:809 stop:1492 length:684 start_codon:yes stop_codon:yes gene_type:complete